VMLTASTAPVNPELALLALDAGPGLREEVLVGDLQPGVLAPPLGD
jgi:hypothetical protein